MLPDKTWGWVVWYNKVWESGGDTESAGESDKGSWSGRDTVKYVSLIAALVRGQVPNDDDRLSHYQLKMGVLFSAYLATISSSLVTFCKADCYVVSDQYSRVSVTRWLVRQCHTTVCIDIVARAGYLVSHIPLLNQLVYFINCWDTPPWIGQPDCWQVIGQTVAEHHLNNKYSSALISSSCRR